MHDLGRDVGETGTPPWFTAAVASGLVALERRLAAEARMDELDEPPRTADARTSDRPELYRRECVPSAG
jgi:hypothetical protein